MHKIRTPLLAFVGVLCLVLSGCGSSKNAIPIPPPVVYPDPSGNWTITADSAYSSLQILQLSGIFSASGSKVSGNFIIPGASCYYVTQNGLPAIATIPVSGSIDAGGNLSLASSPVAGQVITMKGVISADGSTLSAGSYSVSGGCADADHGTVSGNRVPSFTGSFSGAGTFVTLISDPNPVSTPVTVSLQLTQGAAAVFSYALSGSVTITGSPCFSKGASSMVSNQPLTGGVIYGANVGLFFTMDDGSTILMTGTTDPTGRLLLSNFSVAGGSCSGQTASGTLTRQ